MKFEMLDTEEINEEIQKLTQLVSKKCLKCGYPAQLALNEREQSICTWRSCKYRTNIWKNTIFYKTRLSKDEILRILELWMQKASYSLISYITKLSRQSICRILSIVSKKLSDIYYEKCKKIGGNGTIVEIDESKFGKRKYNKGHKVEGVWIFGMVERTVERRIHLVAVENRKAETLTNELTNNVSNDSIVLSDCWKGYKDIIVNFADHLQVNHSKYFKDPSSGVHTNTIEGNWAGVKMHVPFRGRTKDKINLYLIRFMILRNESSIHPLKSLLNYIFYLFFSVFFIFFFWISKKKGVFLNFLTPVIFVFVSLHQPRNP